MRPHPWPQITPRLLAEGWRSWYTLALATPGLGPWVAAAGLVAKILLSRGNVGAPFTDEEMEIYLDGFRVLPSGSAISQPLPLLPARLSRGPARQVAASGYRSRP